MKVLLADDNAERAAAVEQTLCAPPPAVGHHAVGHHAVGGGAAGHHGVTVLRLRQGDLLSGAVAALAPDIVLVGMARPDCNALEGIRQIALHNPCPVVLFVDADDPAFMEEAIGAGVLSYNVVGQSLPDVKPILRAAAALFRRHQSVEDALRQAEKRLREREIIDRAKAILIKQRRYNEPDAYKWLRRQAMCSARRIADVAEELVRTTKGDVAKGDVA